jgi:hypothetical protein
LFINCFMADLLDVLSVGEDGRSAMARNPQPFG